MCLSKGDNDAAALCLQQAAVEFERLLIKKDRLLLTAAGLVMTILHQHSQGDIARKVITSANQVAMRLLPPEHPIRVTMQYLTASADMSQKEAGINSRVLKTVWHNFSLFYEGTHEYIIAARYNYAWMLKFEGQLEAAEIEARAVYDLSCQVLGKLHMQSITCLAVIAGCIYENRPRLNECIGTFELVVRDTELCLGVHHPYTLEAKRRMAEKILQRDGPSERTLHLYRDVLWGRARMLGLGHQFTVAAREGYEDELQTLGLWKQRNGEPSDLRREVEELFSVPSPSSRSWTRIDKRRRRSTNRYSNGTGTSGRISLEFGEDELIDDEDEDDELVLIESRRRRRSESPRNTAGGYGAY